MHPEIDPADLEPTKPDHVYPDQDYEMTPEEMAELDADIAAADEDIRMGRVFPLEEALAEARRTYRIAG
ncbi:hypothetical protein Terro_0260 [Terriglobus roseus DSM 18391]|uniref:Uncharacterized protein n=1 Tax=Terriglobus roseus (strain DSM 18391 / NRRL B-41598 / KBS 63) TaxID=926566 RepID=I3ZBJ1_TERRK|nr:hypothetical protein [Terriglobus roseus]AFL86609.1 hypothetical protein Terro_0260 [Terriglobus roseus DSM 18391]